jgi:hypothetical protein
VFDAEFPEWQLKKSQPMMPVLYLLSGGLSQRGLMPAFTFGFWGTVEALLEPAMGRVAMFAAIVLERV